MQALQPAFGSLQSLRFGNSIPPAPRFGADEGKDKDSVEGGGDEFKGASRPEGEGKTGTDKTGPELKAEGAGDIPNTATPSAPQASRKPNWTSRILLALGIPVALAGGWFAKDVTDQYQIVPRQGQAIHAPAVPGAGASGDENLVPILPDNASNQHVIDAFAQMGNGFRDADRNAVIHNQGDNNTTVIISGDGDNQVTIGVPQPERQETKPPKERRETRTDERRTETRKEVTGQSDNRVRTETRHQEEQQIGVIHLGGGDDAINRNYVDAFGNAILGDGTAIVQDPMGDDWFRSTIRRGGGRIIHLEDRYHYGIRFRIGGVVVVIRNDDFLFQNRDILYLRGNNIIVRRHGHDVYTHPFLR